jgi:hypothetical protein
MGGKCDDTTVLLPKVRAGELVPEQGRRLPGQDKISGNLIMLLFVSFRAKCPVLFLVKIPEIRSFV